MSTAHDSAVLSQPSSPGRAASKALPASLKATRPPKALDPAETELAADAAEEEEVEEGEGWTGFFRISAAMFSSTIVHLVAVVAMALFMIDQKREIVTHEVVAQVVDEEIEKNDLLKVELNEQLFEVTEKSEAAAFSAAPIAGQIGASGPMGINVSQPTVEKGVLEQLAATEIKIGDLSLGAPSTRKMMTEAPAGQIGEARQIVDNYAEALDQITQEILWMMEKGKVLVVWCFDQSESMKDDQKEIRDRIEYVYKELGILSPRVQDFLSTGITSYGGDFAIHTERPTSELSEIRRAIDSVPIDPSGKEMMCQAVGRSIATFRPYVNRTQRQMALVLVTDESGDRADNERYLEQAIAEAKAAHCRVYVLGREAVFGYPYAHMRWVHPQTKHVHWLQIDRGPETGFVEALQTDGFHRRYDAHSSGFGPYEVTRLGRETGGIFFMLPSVETDLVHGEKRRYELEKMRPYLPDLRSRAELKREYDKSPLRSTLENVIYDLNPYNEVAQKIIEMRVHFSIDHPTFIQQARIEQAKAIIYLQYLRAREQQVTKLLSERSQESHPRWQANYDLLAAQIVAYQARMYEYGAALEEFIKKPKIVPATKSPNLRHVRWDITTRQKTLTKEVEPYMERATEMFKAVIENHPGTPWAARAEWELRRGYGVQLVEVYHEPDPVLPPGTVLKPVPKL
jgi:hypothetical protein